MTTAQELLLLRRAILATVEVTKATNAPGQQRGLARKEERQRTAIRRVAVLFTDPMEPTEEEIGFACGD